MLICNFWLNWTQGE